jgi:hypothetical protein
MPWDYWREEIDHVIKGRGLTSYERYADLVRVGRRTRLGPEQRRAVWDLYCEYERQLHDLGVWDFNDVLLLALAEVRRRRPEPATSVWSWTRCRISTGSASSCCTRWSETRRTGCC